MRYEVMIGTRYLYGGRKRDPVLLVLAGLGLVVMLVGIALLIASGGASTAGVVVFVGGLVAAMVCALLAVFSVFISVSVLGVALGVAALTIVLAVTTGFQAQFRDKVLGVNAHVSVVKSQETFAEYRDVMRLAKSVDPDVIAVQPFIFAEMLVTRGKGQLSGVAIKGIDPTLVSEVLDLDKYILPPATLKVLEAHDGGAPPIIIGTELAHKLKAKVGDDITVVVPLSNVDLSTLHATTPRTKKFRIAGLFYSGFDEYDRRLVYAALAQVQVLIGRDDQVMGVELKVRDLDRADEIAEKLDKALGGPPFQVQDWYELNRNLFTALNVQKLVLAIILTLIIIVAAVNMVSALTMMVTDKTREIAILKSMGGTSGSIAQIFQVVGIAIGGAGTIIGVGIGLAVCAVLSRYGFRLDPKVYLIDELPVVVRPLEVVLVAGVTMVISVVTTLVPAWTASALTPLEGLRYD